MCVNAQTVVGYPCFYKKGPALKSRAFFIIRRPMILTVKSKARAELIDITTQVQQAVFSAGVKEGFCMLYVPHTTAAVTINESADPSVKEDILMILNKIVPWEGGYRHLEGNSPAHVKATLVGASEWIAVENGQLVLGTWQGIFFCEFDGPRTRKLHVRLLRGNDKE
jgi:secondary thiamine-phosphate synthase enzyme